MAGFSNLDAIINAISVNSKKQALTFQKTGANSPAAGTWVTMWTATGIPSAGSYPTAGLGNAATCDSSTAGAMPFTNSTAPATMHMLGVDAFSTQVGSSLFVDRLAHVQLAHNVNGTISPALDGTARLGTGEGAQLIAIVSVTLGVAANTFTITYTNQDGTGSRVTPSFTTTANQTVGKTAPASSVGLFIPLQAGDTGVRSVQSIALTSGSNAVGNFTLDLVRPLSYIPFSIASVGSARDHVLELPNLVRVRDSACLASYFFGTASTATTLVGEIRIAEN